MSQSAILPQIKKIVFLMMENRSLDNVLGWLYQGKHQPAQVYPEGSSPTYNGLKANTFSNPDANGDPVYVQAIPADIWQQYHAIPYADPFESMLHPFEDDPRPPYDYFRGVMNQFFGGQNTISRMPTAADGTPKMQGFLNDYSWALQLDWHGHDILWTYSQEQLPVLNGLARQFAVSDAWFSSVPSNTNPNRAYSICGTSLGRSMNQNVFAVEQFDAPTVFNYLSDAGKSWGVFYHTIWQNNQPFTTYTFPKMLDAKGSYQVEPIKRFYELAKQGKLPDFSYLEPKWTDIMTGKGGDYHPPSDPGKGAEQFLHDVYQAVRNSPHWHETLLIVTFDEHGGTYDHVGPPWGAINPDGLYGEKFFDFDLFGARVPTILVSPYIQPGTVFRPDSDSKYPFDHTSFIKTLLRWAGVDLTNVNLGKRMPEAPTFEGCFTGQPLNVGLPADIAAPAFSTMPVPPGTAHPAGSADTLAALCADIPVVATRALLKQNLTHEALTAETSRYRQDPAQFEQALLQSLEAAK